jgi:hypothetical protein
VPKTAGSTVNEHLKAAMPNGRTHCEAIIHKDDEFGKAANSLDWLSGHVNLSVARNRLAAVTDRPIRYFSCLREPTRQVCSHYNWLIEIQARGPAFYNRHPPAIKEISERIRRTDNSSASAIIENLMASRGLFLNMQARLSLGNEFRWATGQIYQQYDIYEMIRTESGLEELVSTMTGQPLRPLVRANESGYHFDKTIFDCDEMQGFLRRNNTLDRIVYDIVRSL